MMIPSRVNGLGARFRRARELLHLSARERRAYQAGAPGARRRQDASARPGHLRAQRSCGHRGSILKLFGTA